MFTTLAPGGSYLSRERLSVKAGQTIVIQIESAECARISHHDVLQFRQPVVPQIEVLELGQTAESLSLDLGDPIVLQVELRQRG